MQERGNRNREGARFLRAEMTLQDVADIMGLTKQRVQQIETLALKKLKRLLLEDEEFWRLLDDFEGVDVMGKFDNSKR
jgi:DNA-directed RNA polymerase sigma subunit (sigma70/sigma32)